MVLHVNPHLVVSSKRDAKPFVEVVNDGFPEVLSKSSVGYFAAAVVEVVKQGGVVHRPLVASAKSTRPGRTLGARWGHRLLGKRVGFLPELCDR